MGCNTPQIPPESRQPAGPGDPGQAPGRFLLRRGCRASTRIRPPAQQGLISGFYARSEGAADLDLRTGPATVWAGLARGVATRRRLLYYVAGPLATVAGRRGGTHRQ